MLKLLNDEPLLAIWFGNFYRPAFDDKAYVDRSMELIHELGFNCVELDSKAWEDFEERYRGGEASQYVAAQEYMMESAERNGLEYCFLALYLNGDNLYPNIRFSPPILGESVIRPDGSDGKWYRYWSSKAKDSMEKHVSGLLKLYGDKVMQVYDGKEKVLPICSMWDPIVAPSFDEEGRGRYLGWLKEQYGTIQDLNRAYRTDFRDFAELRKEDYWFGCKYGDGTVYSIESREQSGPEFLLWCDNMKWKRRELRLYFQEMQARFSKLSPKLYLLPNMAQWSYFLNVDGSRLSGVGFADLWDTGMRGIDIYELAPYVENCHFTTVPVTPAGDADAYVVSCQHSMMRCMNQGRDFQGGIFWGRFLYNDIYQAVSPCEIVGSIVASGAKGIWAYGMNGLDDGGILDRMDKGFLESLQTANCWAKQVIPLLEGKPESDIAILFPSAMACFEPLVLKNSDVHRLDLLGWYKACCDLGFNPDVIDAGMVEQGILERYKVLLVPVNTCYQAEIREEAEKAVFDWSRRGGVVLHGPEDAMMQRIFQIQGEPHKKDSLEYGEGVLTGGDRFCSYQGEEVLAVFSSDRKGSVVRNGNVFSFGFLFGASYTAKIAPHVPPEYKNNAFYPVREMKNNILKDILERYLPVPEYQVGKGVEKADFPSGCVIINHTPFPVSLGEINGKKIFQYFVKEDCLLPHSAVAVIKENAAADTR